MSLKMRIDEPSYQTRSQPPSSPPQSTIVVESLKAASVSSPKMVSTGASTSISRTTNARATTNYITSGNTKLSSTAVETLPTIATAAEQRRLVKQYGFQVHQNHSQPTCQEHNQHHVGHHPNLSSSVVHPAPPSSAHGTNPYQAKKLTSLHINTKSTCITDIDPTDNITLTQKIEKDNTVASPSSVLEIISFSDSITTPASSISSAHAGSNNLNNNYLPCRVLRQSPSSSTSSCQSTKTCSRTPTSSGATYPVSGQVRLNKQRERVQSFLQKTLYKSGTQHTSTRSSNSSLRSFTKQEPQQQPSQDYNVECGVIEKAVTAKSSKKVPDRCLKSSTENNTTSSATEVVSPERKSSNGVIHRMNTGTIRETPTPIRSNQSRSISNTITQQKLQSPQLEAFRPEYEASEGLFLESLEQCNSSDNASADTPVQGPDSQLAGNNTKRLSPSPFIQDNCDHLLESGSIDSRSSYDNASVSIGSSAELGIGGGCGDSEAGSSVGIIGIARPSYELTNTESFAYHHHLTPTRPLTSYTAILPTSNNINESSKPALSIANTCFDGDEVVGVEAVGSGAALISPKKRFVSTLNVDTSFALAAVCEEEEEEEDESDHKYDRDDLKKLHNSSNQVGEVILDSDEGEIVFHQDGSHLVNSPPRAHTGQVPLFDSPFDSNPVYRDDDEDLLGRITEETTVGKYEKTTASNHKKKKLKSEEMFSFSRFLPKSLNHSTAATSSVALEESSRCSSSSGTGSNVKHKNRQVEPHSFCIMKQKSSESKYSTKQTFRQKWSSTTSPSNEVPKLEIKSSSSISIAETENIGCFTTCRIFLLLMEPNTKVFELIHLSYPVQTTTIADILRMIPRNATEKSLGTQSYIGITRPKKRSVAITNFTLLASSTSPSSSLKKPIAAEDAPSAQILDGEIIIAIPTGCDKRSLVALGKQILSNPQIRELLGKSDKRAKASDKEKKMKSKSKTADDVAKSQNGKLQIQSSEFSVQKAHRPSVNVQYSPSSRQKSPEKDNAALSKPSDLINENIFVPVFSDPDPDPFERYEKEIQRALEKAAQSNSGRDISPIESLSSSSACKIVSGQYTTVGPDSINTMFPHFDTLDNSLVSGRAERSSSITSRESRTIADELDDSFRDSYTASNTMDDTSLTGSLESSFNCWSRSLDCSMVSRYNESVKSSFTERTCHTTKTDSTSMHILDTPSSRLRRKRLTQTLLRWGVRALLFTFLRYLVDTQSGYWSASARFHRASISLLPMGITGFVHCLLCVISLLKFQRYLMKQHSRDQQLQQQKTTIFCKKKNSHQIAPVTSMCPIMQAAYDLYEILSVNGINNSK